MFISKHLTARNMPVKVESKRRWRITERPDFIDLTYEDSSISIYKEKRRNLKFRLLKYNVKPYLIAD
jgi:hypothetical protein